LSQREKCNINDLIGNICTVISYEIIHIFCGAERGILVDIIQFFDERDHFFGGQRWERLSAFLYFWDDDSPRWLLPGQHPVHRRVSRPLGWAERAGGDDDDNHPFDHLLRPLHFPGEPWFR